ncbi:5-formyltetrahydrofolate cyclo-ligase isoform X3 [Eptesicus fuscus]|uniref:5-formyltetrahydrofolate cyclo-ligase isoform X3 n=1 Tax=Eptesicus fuscus TaxID=29078 RepID=UPI002404026F|nr:5-formyltetrahydrofolate cyclo-ligase isoform X3 [Eptesicus fuscus]
MPVLRREQVMAHSQYQKAQRVSIFLSMHDEIETDEIIKDIFRRGKTCFIPRYQFQSSHMDMVRLASPEEIASLPKTSWNIHQPDEDEAREEALSTGLGVTQLPRSYHPGNCTFSAAFHQPCPPCEPSQDSSVLASRRPGPHLHAGSRVRQARPPAGPGPGLLRRLPEALRAAPAGEALHHGLGVQGADLRPGPRGRT